jgi:uncharacterized protein (DUF1778 family)
MPYRTALLIRCSEAEATIIRDQAGIERRTISAYVLDIVLRSLDLEQILSIRWPRASRQKRTRAHELMVRGGSRSAILLRCSQAEARLIRSAASEKGTTISASVLRALRRWWEVQTALPEKSMRDTRMILLRELLRSRPALRTRIDN